MPDDIDRLLLIRISGKLYSIDLTPVAEVTELPETWPIPLAPVFFRGVMNSHGSLIPLLDLASWMRAGVGSSEGKVLVLDRRLADLALLVDEVERAIFSSDTELLRQGEGLTVAILGVNGQEVPLISAAELVSMLESDLQGVGQSKSARQQETA